MDRTVLSFVLAAFVAAGLMVGALHVVEFALSPYRSLPANGTLGDQRYTWGHLVENNRLGFRERDFDSLKPPGTYRVMVLGDSFTWGVGLAPDERYTAVAERLLNSASADRVFEVLNFGVPGIPTTMERDILEQYRAVVDPDRIVVGFCINDPQPLYMAWSSERQRLAESAAGHAVRGSQMLLRALGLPWIARLPGEAFYGIAEWAGRIPVWQVALQRTYETSSDEWADFLQALRDIKSASDASGLPPPIFAVLNSGRHSSDFSRPPAYLQQDLAWSRQAEEAARGVGFVAYNHEHEIPRQIPSESLWVNTGSGHPSAGLHRVYGEKLYRKVIEAVDAGEMFRNQG